MWREMAPDARTEIEVDGHRIVAYGFGRGDETVFCLNGGPGLPCDYLRDAHSCLVDHGYRMEALRQERVAEEARGRLLQLDIERLSSPGRIEEYATTRLQMIAPGLNDAIVLPRVVLPARPPSSVVAAR